MAAGVRARACGRLRGLCGWCGLSFNWHLWARAACGLGTSGAHGIPGRFSRGYGWLWCSVVVSGAWSVLRCWAVLPVQALWRSPSAATEDRNQALVRTHHKGTAVAVAVSGDRGSQLPGPVGDGHVLGRGGRRQRRPRIATAWTCATRSPTTGGGRRQRRPRIATGGQPPPQHRVAGGGRRQRRPRIATRLPVCHRDPRRAWRSPSAATEDRNRRARAARGSGARVAVAVSGDRGSQPSLRALRRRGLGRGGRRQRRPRIATTVR